MPAKNSKDRADVSAELHPAPRKPSADGKPATVIPIGTAAAPEQRERLEARRGRPESYPWKRWTDGRIHTVQRRKHFKSKPRSFVRILQRRATRDGLTVVVHVEGSSSIRFQFTPIAKPQA